MRNGIVLAACLIASYSAHGTPIIQVQDARTFVEARLSASLDSGPIVLYESARTRGIAPHSLTASIAGNFCSPFSDACDADFYSILARAEAVANGASTFAKVAGALLGEASPTAPSYDGVITHESALSLVSWTVKVQEADALLSLNAIGMDYSSGEGHYHAPAGAWVVDLTSSALESSVFSVDREGAWTETTLKRGHKYAIWAYAGVDTTFFGDWDDEEPEAQFFFQSDARVVLPEPTTLTLMLLGIVSAGFLRVQKARSTKAPT